MKRVPRTDVERAAVRRLAAEGIAVAVIARKLRIGQNRVRDVLADLGGLMEVRQASGVRTMHQVALLFGAPERHTERVENWIRHGWLQPVTDGAKHHKIITDAALRSFLACRDGWPAWSPSEITDPAIRRSAEYARYSIDGEWWTVAEFARNACVVMETVYDWRRGGKLDGCRLTRYGRQWFIWSVDARAFIARRQGRSYA